MPHEWQEKLMLYCPATGEKNPYPSHAKQWREYHDGKAFLFNPWHGNSRDAYDVANDRFGMLIQD